MSGVNKGTIQKRIDQLKEERRDLQKVAAQYDAAIAELENLLQPVETIEPAKQPVEYIEAPA